MRGTRRLALVLALLCTAGLITIPARAARSCAWQARIDAGALNTLYPDRYATYWTTVLPAVKGATLRIHGTFPHARYMSFVAYAATLQSADGLHDSAIVPDGGAPNPFVAGNPRTGRVSYTVRVRFLGPNQTPPASRQVNTVYTSNADGSKRGATFTVIYRVYRPDRAFDRTGDMSGDRTGGVGVPSVSYVLSNGTVVAIPTCPYRDLPATHLNDTIANAGTSSSGTGPHYPGFDPPVWHKFQNFVRSLSQGLTESQYTGTTISDALKPAADALPNGGFADNPDNNYVFAVLSHGYGQLAVFQALLPTAPDTFPNATTMPGGTQLRYWSMCSNDGPSERFYGCVMDDVVRPTIDAGGRYTVVVSTAADRPASTINPLACHCVWLPWGPSGSVVMIMRNMLPDPTFTNAIQFAHYGSEQQDLGAYYPTGCYMTAADFDGGRRCA